MQNRSNIGGYATQTELIEQTHQEISQSRNLNEIRRSIDQSAAANRNDLVKPWWMKGDEDDDGQATSGVVTQRTASEGTRHGGGTIVEA